jgi:hypothetical protein
MGSMEKPTILKSIKRALVVALVLITANILVWLLLGRSSPVVLAPEMI